MVAKVLIKRTATPNAPPSGLTPGELAVEMDSPTRLWVGVPTAQDPSGKKLLLDLSATPATSEPAITPGTTLQYWRGDKTWQPLDHMQSTGGDIRAHFASTTFAINDKADGSGTNVLTVNDIGHINALDSIRCVDYCDVRAKSSTNVARFTFSNAAGTTTPAVIRCDLATNNVYCENGTGVFTFNSNGVFQINNATAIKIGGGSWQAPSDARIKTVVGDYTQGLEAIKQILPVIYTYNGNASLTEDTPPESTMEADTIAKEHIGLVAQDAEVPMPELVSRSIGWIDGEQVDDLRMLDPSALTFALVNAVKELSAEVEALKTQVSALS